jgi:site-specific recombinase XerD
LTAHPRASVRDWIENAKLPSPDFLFPNRHADSEHLSPRQYARIVKRWVLMIGVDPREYGTHSLRRTKATLVYRTTKNLRAVQLLLAHRRIGSTVRYLDVEIDDALEMSEHIEC